MDSPLRLSPKARAELKTIWREDTGEALSDEAVDAMGWRLLRMFDVVERASARRRARETRFEPPSI